MPKHIFTTAWIGKGEGILRDWHKILGRRDYALDDEEDWLIVDSNVLKYLKDTKDEKNPNKTMLQVAEEKGVKVITDHQVFDDIINSDEDESKYIGTNARDVYNIKHSLAEWSSAIDVMRLAMPLHPDIKNGDIYIYRDSDITFGAKRATNVAPMKYGIRTIHCTWSRGDMGDEESYSLSHSSTQRVMKEIDHINLSDDEFMQIKIGSDTFAITKGSLGCDLLINNFLNSLEKLKNKTFYYESEEELEYPFPIQSFLTPSSRVFKYHDLANKGTLASINKNVLKNIKLSIDTFGNFSVLPFKKTYSQLWEANHNPQEHRLEQEIKFDTGLLYYTPSYPNAAAKVRKLRSGHSSLVQRGEKDDVKEFFAETLLEPSEIGIVSRQNDRSWDDETHPKSTQETSDIDSDLDISDPDFIEKLQKPKKFDMSKRESRIDKIEKIRAEGFAKQEDVSIVSERIKRIKEEERIGIEKIQGVYTKLRIPSIPKTEEQKSSKSSKGSFGSGMAL